MSLFHCKYVDKHLKMAWRSRSTQTSELLRDVYGSLPVTVQRLGVCDGRWPLLSSLFWLRTKTTREIKRNILALTPARAGAGLELVPSADYAKKLLMHSSTSTWQSGTDSTTGGRWPFRNDCYQLDSTACLSLWTVLFEMTATSWKVHILCFYRLWTKTRIISHLQKEYY